MTDTRTQADHEWAEQAENPDPYAHIEEQIAELEAEANSRRHTKTREMLLTHADTLQKLLEVARWADYIVNHLTIDRVYGDSICFEECRKALAALEEK